jgi:hypothetical protein
MKKLFTLVALAGLGLAAVGCGPKPAVTPPAQPAPGAATEATPPGEATPAPAPGDAPATPPGETKTP